MPQFTIQLGNHSYEVPLVTTTTTNQYTGQQTTTTQPGYYVENMTIDIAITNQPFVPVNDTPVYETNLYYDVQLKGHFEENWTDHYYYDEYENLLPQQSASEYTVISVPQDYPIDAR